VNIRVNVCAYMSVYVCILTIRCGICVCVFMCLWVYCGGPDKECEDIRIPEYEQFPVRMCERADHLYAFTSPFVSVFVFSCE